MNKLLTLSIMAFLTMGCSGKNGKADGQETQNDTAALGIVAAGNDAGGEALAPAADNDDSDMLDISALPKAAERKDSHGPMAVYVNVEQKPTEDDPEGIFSVWLADEQAGKVRKVCQTASMVQPQWERMNQRHADAVDVPIDQIASASSAYMAPGGKVFVEGCPDARNVWTYVIDPDEKTARQFPSTEGVVSIDWDNEEIVLSAYRYDVETGRYSYTTAYSPDGKYIRTVDERVDE